MDTRPRAAFIVKGCLLEGKEYLEQRRSSRGTISPPRSPQQLWSGWRQTLVASASTADTHSLRRSLPIHQLALISHTRARARRRDTWHRLFQQGARDIKPNLFFDKSIMQHVYCFHCVSPSCLLRREQDQKQTLDPPDCTAKISD